MRTIRYEVDPFNRLVILPSDKESGLHKFRKVLDGRFSIDENNSLSYHVKAPLSGAEKIPHQLRIKGRWSITDSYDLRFTVDKSGRDTFGDALTLQGEILDVNANSILFCVTTKTDNDKSSTYVLNLEGSWKADKSNRLSFRVRREKGECDILTFNAAWEINKDHQLVYKYEKAALLRRKKELHSLLFKGYWDIRDRFRIAYLFGADTDSGFDFKTSAGIFREGYIKYELGIGFSGKVAPVKRVITLFGSWKLKRDAGLVFEVEYEDGRQARAITFGVQADLKGRDMATFRLMDAISNKDIGVELELSRKIFEGEAFLRLLKSGRESAVYAGAAWRW